MTAKMIYLLEDDPDILELVTMLLVSNGYQVEAFSTANDFTRRITSVLPDICILDVNLPDGNGLDISNGLSQSPQTNHIPILIMSAKHFSQAQYKRVGARGGISKPFSIDVFLTAVAQL